jgi:DNA-binding transcriptional MerR regulator
MSGVSVRAIQHYHRIGLMEPSKIGENGYRYYDENKILELQQILFFKELDFSLSEIRGIMKNPLFSIEKSLSKQKELIFLKLERLNNIVDLIDKTLENQKGENKMSGRDYFEEMSEEKVKEYTKRAKEAYGEKVVNESVKNVKKEYNNDYNRMQKEFEDWLDSVKSIMNKGHDSIEAQELMDEWYKKIKKTLIK